MNYYNNPMCHDDCIGCLISECDHNQEYGEAFEKHQELLDTVIYELNTIIHKWKTDDDDVLSAPVYNEEEDRMEMKCWYPCDEPFNRWLSDNEILIW